MIYRYIGVMIIAHSRPCIIVGHEFYACYTREGRNKWCSAVGLRIYQSGAWRSEMIVCRDR